TVGAWVTAQADGVTAFYDIDTPVTIAKLRRGDYEYISPELIQAYDIYMSFAGGPILEVIKTSWGAPMAVPLYCSVDSELYYPEEQFAEWDLGYLGTYSADRQPALDTLLVEPARAGRGAFVVAGPGYPE